MIAQGLLLDYGGVLTTSVLDSFGAFCVSEGIDPQMFREIVLETAREPDSIFHQVETGRIAQEDFDLQLAKILSEACGKDIGHQGLKQRLFAASTPDERMLNAVREAKSNGVRTALVSNSWGGADYPREQFGELFDAVIISGEVGLRKPDAEIYLLAASRIGVEPNACVFVDDFRVNVEGAQAVGMAGVLHRDTDATIQELTRLLGVNLGRL
jgi:epoxide hydrolase-like predicted phosphatase